MKIKVFIPSYKRAGKVESRKVIKGSIIACHNFEEKEYREKEGGEILVIPDELRGNIAKVRNYILDNANCKRIVMMDDDISAIGYNEQLERHDFNEDQVLSFLTNGFVMADDLGVSLWGINLQCDPKFYREYSPISLLGVILGTFSCHYKPVLRYDENLFLNEDYDFFLKTIKKYRKALRFNKYFYQADHITKKGGCAAYRMKDTEIQQALIMQRRWGKRVFKFDIKRSTNGQLFIPLKGI